MLSPLQIWASKTRTTRCPGPRRRRGAGPTRCWRRTTARHPRRRGQVHRASVTGKASPVVFSRLSGRPCLPFPSMEASSWPPRPDSCAPARRTPNVLHRCTQSQPQKSDKRTGRFFPPLPFPPLYNQSLFFFFSLSSPDSGSNAPLEDTRRDETFVGDSGGASSAAGARSEAVPARHEHDDDAPAAALLPPVTSEGAANSTQGSGERAITQTYNC